MAKHTSAEWKQLLIRFFHLKEVTIKKKDGFFKITIGDAISFEKTEEIIDFLKHNVPPVKFKGTEYEGFNLNSQRTRF